MDNKKLCFLTDVTTRIFDNYFVLRWHSVFNDCESLVNSFFKDGLIRIATDAEKFIYYTNLEGYKELSRQHGLKVTGTKKSLADSLLSIMPSDKIHEMVVNIQLYKATQQGNDIISRFAKNKEVYLSQTLLKMSECFMNRNVKQAKQILSDYYKDYEVVKYAERNSAFSLSGTRETEIILELSYRDIITEADKYKHIPVIIALGFSLANSHLNIAKNIITLVGTFNCPNLSNYLIEKHQDQSPYIYSDIMKAEMYVNTKIGGALCRGSLESMQRIGKGIKIVTSNGCCKTCLKNSKLVLWKDISALPVLPLHWECRCAYIAVQ